MASANNQFESGESFTKTADSAGNGGIARASAEAYATGATQAANYSDGNAHSCLPQVQLYDSSAGSGGAAADVQTLNDFQGVNESFANLTNQYATAISDLGAGGNSPNAVADLANLYGSMTQSGNQLGNVSYEQGSTYTNDSNLQ
ncbi:MAG TPA: hypothetical protein V6C72_08240, partial [Chroococcales cyanobacterium]